jgi:signal transduction histidine kinase
MVEGLNAFLGLRGVAVNLRPTQLEQLIESARRILSPLLEQSAGSITLDTPSLPLICDPDLMLRVFQNLFNNALKFRAERRPEIRVSSRRSGDHIEIAVTDNGMGFDDAHSERIFQMFLRLVPRSYEGNGIGLAICREVLELHGGSIRATSTPGEGSTFILSLRAA